MAQASQDKQPYVMTASVPLMMRLVKTYIRPYWRLLAFAVVLMLISAGMTAALAKCVEPAINNISSYKSNKILWEMAIAALAIFVIRGAVTYGHNVIMNSLGQRITSDVNRAMFSHLVYSDLAYFHGLQSGQLLSRFISDTSMMRTATVEGITGFGKNTFTVIFLISLMFYQDWKLSLLSIFVFPTAFYFVQRTGRRLRKISHNTQMQTGDLTSILNQSFQGARHIKSYVTEEFEKQRINKTIESIYQLVTRSYRISAAVVPVAETLSGLAVATILVIGGHEVIAGTSSPGKLISFIAAFGLAFDPMKRLANLNNTMQLGLAAVDRLFKLLDVAPAIADKPGAAALQIRNPVVRFENVVFAYPDGSEALRGVSFEAPAGKTIALVGESGAGKSTILSLIPRFYDVGDGEIKIDGQDIRAVTLQSLRKNMALVSQEVAIFNDTIRDNIAYGSPGATEEQIVAAATQAAAHDFISELADGYNTMVGEHGVKLSGGQRQRISIARAMLKNAPILLLDEATSSLDANSERLVQAALERLQQGRTTIVVAHRLSTIIGADIIYVLAHGKVIESGSHTALLAQNGAYARLYGNLLKESA